MAEKLKRSKDVENHIIRCIEGGVGIREMIASMQHLQNAPKSLSTLYKNYGDVIHSKRAAISAKVGKRVIDHALEGDMESKSTQWAAELFLRSKGGWSPTNTVVESDGSYDEETDESAVDTLMAMLGITVEDDKKEE